MRDREHQSSWWQPDQGLVDPTVARIVIGLGVVVPIGMALFAIGAMIIVGQSR
jgi:hypothetical protein